MDEVNEQVTGLLISGVEKYFSNRRKKQQQNNGAVMQRLSNWVVLVCAASEVFLTTTNIMVFRLVLMRTLASRCSSLE